MKFMCTPKWEAIPTFHRIFMVFFCLPFVVYQTTKDRQSLWERAILKLRFSVCRMDLLLHCSRAELFFSVIFSQDIQAENNRKRDSVSSEVSHSTGLNKQRFNLVKCNLTKLTTTNLAVKRPTSLAGIQQSIP